MDVYRRLLPDTKSAGRNDSNTDRLWKIRCGKGMVSMKNSYQYGDQYATVQIQVPRHLSEEAKQKLREYAACK